MVQLMDLADIAAFLRISRERAADLANGVMFPPTIGVRGSERLWRGTDVELWVRAIGRPRALLADEAAGPTCVRRASDALSPRARA